MGSLQNYTTNERKSQEPERENLYEFEGGRVRLDWRRSPTRFYAIVDNEDMMRGLPEGAHRNPYIAAMYFVQGIKLVLREKIKEWLTHNGYNAVTGCRVDLPCEECRRRGQNEEGKGCTWHKTQ